jgi:hypothetical protein
MNLKNYALMVEGAALIVSGAACVGASLLGDSLAGQGWVYGPFYWLFAFFSG